VSEHSRGIFGADLLTTSSGCRTVSKIERKIVERGKRRATSRLLYGKNFDEETIATWRLDLKRILRVFEVRYVTFICPLLTFRFQTELKMNTHVIVPDTPYGVPNSATITPDIHHKALTSREDPAGQNRTASVPRFMTVTEQSLTAFQAYARSAISAAS
jgi:hypothetical protein